MSTPHDRLIALGLDLPAAPAPLAAYVPSILVPIGEGRALLYVAGQVPIKDGTFTCQGSVPDHVSVDQAQEAARVCALNILAQVEAAVGLTRVEQVVQVSGYVLSQDGFGDQPLVINAASDLLFEVLGEAGRHSRVSVGTNALPKSVSVEIAAVVLVRSSDPREG
ncbi:MAG TPA: RidA family protein [Candidatus Dormibacteraeota bacterium]|jgi:enamine deaminase RidA (YjgF/YER057c/UK114 family)|nr:RidA family protein [Candidatus Dormibacteraeota bacterium]